MFEAKVPPLIWFAIALGFIFAAGDVDSTLDGGVSKVVAVGLLLLGVVPMVAANIKFRDARTTVNPHSLDRASALVTNGVYARTRNPMYLSLLLLLAGWGVWNGSLFALLAGCIGFVLVMNRLQIVVEERVLTAKFGVEYTNYLARVRRWI